MMNKIERQKTRRNGGFSVVPAFSLGHTLAERGLRPQAHSYPNTPLLSFQ